MSAFGQSNPVGRVAISKIEDLKPTTVVSPAMGGLVIGQEVARQLNCRFLFLEKEDDRLVMRRNFKLTDADRVMIVEDVVTRGGRVREALDIVNQTPSKLCAVACLVDRSKGDLDFQTRFQPLLKMNFPTYSPDELPDGLKAIPPINQKLKRQSKYSGNSMLQEICCEPNVKTVDSPFEPDCFGNC